MPRLEVFPPFRCCVAASKSPRVSPVVEVRMQARTGPSPCCPARRHGLRTWIRYTPPVHGRAGEREYPGRTFPLPFAAAGIPHAGERRLHLQEHRADAHADLGRRQAAHSWPKVIGSACTAGVRPPIGVARCACASRETSPPTMAGSRRKMRCASRNRSAVAVSSTCWVMGPWCRHSRCSGRYGCCSARTAGTSGRRAVPIPCAMPSRSTASTRALIATTPPRPGPGVTIPLLPPRTLRGAR